MAIHIRRREFVFTLGGAAVAWPLAAGERNGGLLVPPDAITTARRELIIVLAARYGLPAVYPFRFFVTSGGLMSYGPDSAGCRRLSAMPTRSNAPVPRLRCRCSAARQQQAA